MGVWDKLAKAAIKVVEKPLAKVGVKAVGKTAESVEATVGKALGNSAMKEGRYASKASYTKWMESMGGKAPKVESGFKQWEKSLNIGKSTEHMGAKAGKGARESFFNSTKTSGRTFESSAEAAGKRAGKATGEPGKFAGKAAEEAGKISAFSKESLKTAAGTGWREGGKVINKTAGWFGQYAKFSASHPVASLILSSVAYNKMTGRTLLPDLMKSIGGEDAAKNGLVNTLADVTLGKRTDAQGKEVGKIANLMDILFGDGAYKRMDRQLEAVTGEAVGVYQSMKGSVSSVVGEGADIYQAGKQQIGQYFGGNGMISNGNGGYYDPTTPQYPSTAQVVGTPTAAPSQPQGGLGGTMASSVNAIAGELTGGNVSKMNMLSLLASAYLMFGRFGWLGKAGSLMLGGMTMRDINKHQTEGLSMHQMSRNAVEPAVLQTHGSGQIELSETEEPVVRRSRGL